MNDVCVVSMICNEIEILPMYYRYIKKWCKSWKILEHGSTDGSLEFLERMKVRNEIAIEIFEKPCADFDKDFYKEWNWIITKSDCAWTYVGHIDEISPFMESIIPELMKERKIYLFQREELISLYPPLTMGKENPFLRLFPTDIKAGFVEKSHVHAEVFNVPEAPVIAGIPFYHLGQCRNTEHIRFKEKAYEDCSGSTVLGSKYTDEDRIKRRMNSRILEDKYFPALMDMIL